MSILYTAHMPLQRKHALIVKNDTLFLSAYAHVRACSSVAVEAMITATLWWVHVCSWLRHLAKQ